MTRAALGLALLAAGCLRDPVRATGDASVDGDGGDGGDAVRDFFDDEGAALSVAFTDEGAQVSGDGAGTGVAFTIDFARFPTAIAIAGVQVLQAAGCPLDSLAGIGLAPYGAITGAGDTIDFASTLRGPLVAQVEVAFARALACPTSMAQVSGRSRFTVFATGRIARTDSILLGQAIPSACDACVMSSPSSDPRAVTSMMRLAVDDLARIEPASARPAAPGEARPLGADGRACAALASSALAVQFAPGLAGAHVQSFAGGGISFVKDFAAEDDPTQPIGPALSPIASTTTILLGGSADACPALLARAPAYRDDPADLVVNDTPCGRGADGIYGADTGPLALGAQARVELAPLAGSSIREGFAVWVTMATTEPASLRVTHSNPRKMVPGWARAQPVALGESSLIFVFAEGLAAGERITIAPR